MTRRADPDLLAACAFRPMEPGDVPFVLDSWLKAFRDSPWAGVIGNHRYFEVYRGTIEELLGRGARVEVAAAAHDPTRILGWACTEPAPRGLAAHFVYVKDPFRRRGLASELLARAEERHGTQEGDRLYSFRTRDARHFPSWRHVPEVARRHPDGRRRPR